MSNNLFRKGVAVLASSVLALTGLTAVSAPAAAYTGGTVAYTLASNYGAVTELTVPSAYDFVLKLTPNSGFTHTAANLKLATDTSASNGGFAVDFASSTGVDRYGSGATKGAAISNTDSDMKNVVSLAAATTQYLVVKISDTNVRTNTTYRVSFTVFEENDGSEGPTGVEYKSNTVEVTFLKHADLGWGISLDIGTNTNSAVRTATVTTAAGINAAQMLEQGSAAFQVQFQEADATTPATFGSATTATVSRSAAGVLTATRTVALDAEDRLRARVLFGTGTYGRPATQTNDDVVATALAIMSTPTIATMSSQVQSPANANQTAAGLVRSGTANVSAYVDITVVGTNSRAGVPITFTVSEKTANSLAAAASVAAGGKTLKNTNGGTVQDIEVVVNTVAIAGGVGRATLELVTSGVVDTNALTVTASAQGYSATGRDLTWTAPTVSAVKMVNVIYGNSVFAKNTPFTLNYAVTDQWSQAVTGSGFTVAATSGSTVTAAVVNGAAAVQWPGFATEGAKSFTTSVSKDGVAIGGVSESYDVYIGASDSAANISVSGTAVGTGVNFGVGTDADLELNTEEFSAADTRRGQVAPDAPSGGVTVSGVVTTSTGTAAKTSVTLSGSGLDFVTTDGVYARGSITLQTNGASGEYSVKVVSNLSGSKTLTISSGSVTKTQAMVFAAAALDAGDALTVVSPKSTKAGRTVTFTVSLKDAFGNGVAASTAETVRIAYDGPGFVVSEPTAFSATGVATVRVLLSAEDRGPAVVTASVYTGTALMSASSATWVGPIANAKSGAKKGRVIVEAYRAKGKTVNVFVGGNRVASYVADKANFSKVVRGVRSGDRNVRVVLSGPGEDFRGVITVK